MAVIQRIKKSLAYRSAKSEWDRLAIHYAYEGYRGKEVQLEKLNLTLRKNEHLQLLQGYDSAEKLISAGAELCFVKEALILRFNGISIEIQTAEELFICHEIFVERCYEFRIKEEAIVIDIGMNVGIASLFFASMTSVNKIYGFEPFKPTFQSAITNFNLNTHLREKIISRNIGWSDQEVDMEVDYSPRHRGRVGIFGNRLIKDEVKDATKERLTLKKSKDLLNEITTDVKYSNKKIVLKIDVEGAEFNIFANLGLDDLKKINLIMMEWHIEEPTIIMDKLIAADFSLFKTNYSQDTGMIYASR